MTTVSRSKNEYILVVDHGPQSFGPFTSPIYGQYELSTKAPNYTEQRDRLRDLLGRRVTVTERDGTMIRTDLVFTKIRYQKSKGENARIILDVFEDIFHDR